MTSWRFVGRATELGLLAAAVTAATATAATAGQRGRGLIVGGAKGVGKSRLLREGLAAADSERVAVWTAYATAATTDLPFGSLAHELPANHSPGMSSAAQLRWAVEAVRQRAAGRPIIFALDDVHLLDSLSVALIHLMAHSGHAMVLATHRDGEPVHDSLAALWKDDLVDRIDLAPLSRPETTDLMVDVLGGAVDPATVARLHLFSQGNLALLRELVIGAQAGGDFTEAYGLWRWNGQPRLTASLIEAVDARIGPLDDEVRAVVELVALGEPVGLRLIATATDPTALELADERQLIQIDSHDRRLSVQLAHPLYGEVVRHRCPVTRRHRLLTNLAELVERTGARRQDDQLRIAVWRQESQTIDDPATLVDAARQAFARFDIPLTRRLAGAAVEAGGGPHARELHALSLFFAAQPAEAVQVLAAEETKSTKDRPEVEPSVSWSATRALISYWGLRDQDAISDLAAAAQSLADAEARIIATAVESVLRLHHLDTAEAARLANSVLRCPSAGASARALAGSTTAHLESLAGTAARAERTIAAVEADASAWRTPSPPVQFAVDLARGTGLLLAGDLDRIAGIATTTRAHQYEVGEFSLGLGYQNVLLGQAARLRGKFAEASRYQRKACAVLADGRVLSGLAQAERAHAAALTGAAVEASAAMAEADREHDPTMAILYPFLEHARCWVRMSQGEVDAAAAMAINLAARLRLDGFGAYEAIALHDAVRLGGGDQVVDRLAVLARELDGPVATVLARHARAVVDRDAHGLLAAAEAFAELGFSLHAAEAAAAALNRLRQARSTRIGEAARLFTTLVAACEDPQTPGLVVSRPTLSARERQVARVAAEGLTSKEIADQLFLSTRTVDNHLRRVYAKLGVAGRGELGVALETLAEDQGWADGP